MAKIVRVIKSFNEAVTIGVRKDLIDEANDELIRLVRRICKLPELKSLKKAS